MNLEVGADLSFTGNDDPNSAGLHAEIYKDFVAKVTNGAPMRYATEDASVAVKLICAINESSEKGTVIKL